MKTPYCRKDAKLVVLEAKHMRDTRVSKVSHHASSLIDTYDDL